MKKIFKQSIDLFGKETVGKEVKEVRVDTTVQEKNITFPIDRKLTEKVIEHCKRIAKKEDIKLKRTYTFEIRKLKQQLRFARKPKNRRNTSRPRKNFIGSHSKSIRIWLINLTRYRSRTWKNLMFYTGY